MVSSAEGINLYPLYLRININWTLQFKGAASPSTVFCAVLAARWDFTHCSLHSNSTEGFPWLTNTPGFVFITPETSGMSSGSPSSAVPALPPAAQGSSQPQRSVLRSWAAGRWEEAGEPPWNTEYKSQFPWQPGAAGHEHRYRQQIPQEKGEAAEGRNVSNSFSRSSTICAPEHSLSC